MNIPILNKDSKEILFAVTILSSRSFTHDDKEVVRVIGEDNDGDVHDTYLHLDNYNGEIPSVGNRRAFAYRWSDKNKEKVGRTYCNCE